jgi:hypothetical protein
MRFLLALLAAVIVLCYLGWRRIPLPDIKDFNFWAVVVYLLPGLLMIQARCLAASGKLANITKDSITGFLVVTVLYSLVLWIIGVELQSVASISNLNRGILTGYFIVAPSALG